MPVTERTRHLAHKGDPDSSRNAVERHARAGRRRTHLDAVVKAVERWPGCTGAELAERIGTLGLYEVRRRLSDAAAQALVVRGLARTCQVAQTAAVTWWPVQQPPEQAELDLEFGQ